MSLSRRHPFAIQTVLFICLEIAARGKNVDAKFNVRLLPNNVQLEVGEWATFNCTVSCRIYQTHTIKWFVGDFDSSKRQVDNDVNQFEKRTGIRVRVKNFTTCPESSTHGKSVYELRIYASSVALVNKTPVQCAALTKSPFNSDHYSYYGVVLVKDKQQAPTTTSESVEDEAVTSFSKDIAETDPAEKSTKVTASPKDVAVTASLQNIQPTQCQRETVTVTVKATPTVTVCNN